MKKQPNEIMLAKLEVVVMPNGEVLCLGKTVGWFRDLKNYLEKKEGGQRVEKKTVE